MERSGPLKVTNPGRGRPGPGAVAVAVRPIPRSTFASLGLLLITLAALIAAAVLLGWLAGGPFRSIVGGWDYAVAAAIRSLGLGSLFMDRVLWTLSQLGEMEPVAAVSGAVFFFLLFRRRYADALRIGVPLLGVGIMWIVTASIVYRHRPDYWVLHDPADVGYPSGHVMNAVVLAGLCLYPLVRSGVARWRLLASAALWVIFTASIAAARIYVNAHFASDCFAGFVMGSIWVAVALPVLDSLRPRDRNPC